MKPLLNIIQIWELTLHMDVDILQILNLPQKQLTRSNSIIISPDDVQTIQFGEGQIFISTGIFQHFAFYSLASVGHGSPAGREIRTRTRTRAHRTRGGYGCTPHRVSRGVVRNPRYHRYPRARTTPSPPVNLAKAAHTSIDVRRVSRGDMGGGWAEAFATLLSPRYSPLSLPSSSLPPSLSRSRSHPPHPRVYRGPVTRPRFVVARGNGAGEVMAELLLPPLLCCCRCCRCRCSCRCRCCCRCCRCRCCCCRSRGCCCCCCRCCRSCCCFCCSMPASSSPSLSWLPLPSSSLSRPSLPPTLPSSTFVPVVVVCCCCPSSSFVLVVARVFFSAAVQLLLLPMPCSCCGCRHRSCCLAFVLASLVPTSLALWSVLY